MPRGFLTVLREVELTAPLPFFNFQFLILFEAVQHGCDLGVGGGAPRVEDAAGISIDLKFPHPVSDDRNAIYGTVWLMMAQIVGYEAADYLDIPEIKAILESIRISE